MGRDVAAGVFWLEGMLVMELKSKRVAFFLVELVKVSY